LKIIRIHIRMYSRNNVITITNSLWDDKITKNSVKRLCVMTKVCQLVTVFDAMTTLKRKRLSLREKVDILNYRKNIGNVGIRKILSWKNTDRGYCV